MLEITSVNRFDQSGRIVKDLSQLDCKFVSAYAGPPCCMKNAIVGVFGKPKQSLSEVIGKGWRAVLITYRFNHLILSQFFQHEYSEVYRLA